MRGAFSVAVLAGVVFEADVEGGFGVDAGADVGVGFFFWGFFEGVGFVLGVVEATV